MSWVLIGSGTKGDLNDVASLEAAEVEEGQRAKLDCDTSVPVSDWQIDNLRSSLSFAGVEELQISGSGTRLSISWRKGFPWAAVIILALVAVIVIVAWQMFKDVPGGVTLPLLVIGAVAVAVSLGYFREVRHGQA